ncbi:ATP-binding protein [Desulfosporosinus sp. Sb-LF]|uniref:two-component system sensor histidine kinase NtrB n=1 Tax=Desulfosporosinus sp. Sb-LF TaxID=2560027 RepID=UPI001FB12A02|nr:ATP-binding protein [Desulfosporosinus sp. Sb-LF]
MFMILSLVLIITTIISKTLHLPGFFRIIFAFFPFMAIVLWFRLWSSAWGKAWVMSAALLLVISRVSPSSTLFLLVHVLFLLGVMFLFDHKETQERLLHQRHIKAMRVLLRQSPPLIKTLDYTREAIILLDHTGSIIESNPQSSLLLSLPDSSLLGQSISTVLGILPNFKPDTPPEHGEIIWKNPSGVEKHLRFQTRPLLDFDIQCCTVLLLFDISEEKERSEASLQAAKFLIISEVSAGLAHEIRNPLTTIKGFMQLITPEQWPQFFRPYQQLILDEIQSIDQMLSKFVLLTSPTAPQMKPVDLTEAIHSMAEITHPICLSQSVTLILQLSVTSVHVIGDHEQLLQALLFILNNAIEASPKGEKVIIHLEEQETLVRISIIDYGSGVPKNLRNRVFDPFFTSKKEGTGLGLTIAQQIVLAHHGKLHFSEDEPICGTEVVIDLPHSSSFTRGILSA